LDHDGRVAVFNVKTTKPLPDAKNTVYFTYPPFSALQLRVSFGLLNNQPPFLSVLHLFRRGVERYSEEVRRVWMEEVVAHLFLFADFRSFHPSEADLVSKQFSFYGVRLLASRPTPKLEDRISLIKHKSLIPLRSSQQEIFF
jgi:hypothetical protein